MLGEIEEMDNNSFNNRTGKISAILFVCIVIILLLTFIVCIKGSNGSMNEGTGEGAIWWLFIIAIWFTGIPFLVSRNTCYYCCFSLFKRKKKRNKNG